MALNPDVTATIVRGVTKHQLTSIEDVRGNLVAGEFQRHIPFQPRRYFTVFEVPGPEVRGQHAHRRCEQFLVCLSGSVSVIVDDGAARETIDLRRPDQGLYVPAMTWAVQRNYSPGAILLVLASDYYDPHDYIRDYDEFLALVRGPATRRAT